MADSDDVMAVWPGSPYDLENPHLCPACFTTLTRSVCDRCGLVLTDPRAVRLLELGRTMVGLEDERQSVIEELRLAYAPAPEPVSVAPAPEPVIAPVPESLPAAASALASVEIPVEMPSAAVAAAPAPPLVAQPPVAPAVGPSPEPAVPAPPAPPAKPRRRLSVPVLLLIVGVALVGVAAIFFLGLAWFVAGILVRALIIGGITVAVIAGASLLRRGSLRATAEGVGALGVILLALDAYALRANDFFGSASMDVFVYSGLSALVVGAVCRAWSYFSRLRGPDLAATLALPSGLGLLVGGLLPVDATAAITAGLLGAAAGGLAHVLPVPWSAARAGRDAIVERTALAVLGVAALVVAALLTLFAGVETLAEQSVLAGVTIVIGALHAVLLLRARDADRVPATQAIAAVAASTSALMAGTLGWQLAVQSTLEVFPQLVAPVIAVLVAVGMDRWAKRPVPALIASRIVAAIVALGSVAVLTLTSVIRAERGISAGWIAWQTDAVVSPHGDDLPTAVLAAVAAVMVAALLFAAPTLDRVPLVALRPGVAAVVVIAGAEGTAIPLVVVSVGVLVTAIAAVALARGRSRIGWSIAAGIGTAAAYLAGTATPWLWAVGVAVAVALPLVVRALTRPVPAAAVTLAVAPVGLAAISALIAPSAIGAVAGVTVDPAAYGSLLQWVAVAALACAVLVPRVDTASRNAVGAAAFVVTALSFLAYLLPSIADTGVSSAIGEPAAGVVRGVVLVALLAAVALRRTRVTTPSWIGAALLAPVASGLAAATCDLVDADFPTTVVTAVAASAAVVVVAALVPARGYGAAAPYPGRARTAADLGALATVAVVGWAAPTTLAWAVLAFVAVGFGAASITRGWIGVHTAAAPGAKELPESRAAGLPLAAAPRRLLVWPAFAVATLALWSWLGQRIDVEIEAFVLPPAAGLLIFSALLWWLRRRIESTIALVLSFVLGLIVPAVAGSVGDPLRGTVVGAVSAIAAIALAWTPLRRSGTTAVAGATTALVALGVVAADHAAPLSIDTVWAIALPLATYAAAFGFVRGQRAAGVADTAVATWFAIVVPPIALAAGVMAVLGMADEPIVAAVGIAVLGLLHLAAAALHRAPLATATRWTAFGGAALLAAMAYVFGEIDAIEILGLPLAAVLLAGAALAMRRRAIDGRTWPGPESVAWFAGLALAVVPSVFEDANDPRSWLLIAGALLAAIGCAAVPVPDAAAGLKAPSAALLTLGAVAMGVRALFDPVVESGEYAAIAAGVGALLVAATIVWLGTTVRQPIVAVLSSAGAALLVVTVWFEADGDLARSSLTTVLAGLVGVGGAWLLGRPRWAVIGAPLAIGGLVATVVAVGARFLTLVTAPQTGVEPDLWALAGLGITAAIGIMALHATSSPAVSATVGVVFGISLVLFAGAELLLVGDGDAGADQIRTVLTVSALVAVGVAALAFRARFGLALPVMAAAAALLFGLVALALFGVRPVELVSAPIAVGLVVLGVRRLRRDPAARTWPTVGPGLALLTLPSLVYDFGETALWRVVALGAVALALVVVGAVFKLQAPLVLGSLVLLVHAVAQLWPWISNVYVAVPWWLWLGIGGALLIFLAARYEKQMRAIRSAFTTVTSLR